MMFPNPSFSHLKRLTDDKGLFEHADGTVPRYYHGYCVDDVARALVVVSRDPMPTEDSEVQGISDAYLAFVLTAQDAEGRFHNRLSLDGSWQDQPSLEDCWGRALWGLGTYVSSHMEAQSGEAALKAFTLGSNQRSPWLHSMAFAALGAVEVLKVVPGHADAQSLLEDAVLRIGRPRPSKSWPWPEDRLEYANAVLPEVLVAAGAVLQNSVLQDDGLHLLGWLLDLETYDGHLSVTAVGGRGQDDVSPAFDQQPIEVAALADACATAYRVTGDNRWADGLKLAVQWFLGLNDGNIPLYDPITGGCCDGLEPFGRNENQGAESTLAALSTLQQGLLLTERVI